MVPLTSSLHSHKNGFGSGEARHTGWGGWGCLSPAGTKGLSCLGDATEGNKSSPARRGPPQEACGLARGPCTGLVRSETSHVPEHPGWECWMPLSTMDPPRKGGPKSVKPLPGEATTPTVGVRTPGSISAKVLRSSNTVTLTQPHSVPEMKCVPVS